MSREWQTPEQEQVEPNEWTRIQSHCFPDNFLGTSNRKTRELFWQVPLPRTTQVEVVFYIIEGDLEVLMFWSIIAITFHSKHFPTISSRWSYYSVAVTYFPLCHPIPFPQALLKSRGPEYWLHAKISNKMHERSRNKWPGWKRRSYCARKYKRRNECVTGGKETEGNSGRKNQEPRHRQMMSLSYCSEAQLGEKWIVWT